MKIQDRKITSAIVLVLELLCPWHCYDVVLFLQYPFLFVKSKLEFLLYAFVGFLQSAVPKTVVPQVPLL